VVDGSQTAVRRQSDTDLLQEYQDHFTKLGGEGKASPLRAAVVC
jgi:hypothetical protein